MEILNCLDFNSRYIFEVNIDLEIDIDELLKLEIDLVIKSLKNDLVFGMIIY